MTPLRRSVLVGLLAIIYATCYAAIKAGLAFAPPLRFAGLRAVAAGGSLLLVLLVMRRAVRPPRRLWPWTVLLAASGIVVGYAAMFASPGRTGAGIASVLGNTGPLIIVALARVVFGEPLTNGKWSALVLGFAGASLIAYPAVVALGRDGVLAGLLPLAAATGTAVESVLFKRAEAGSALLSVAAWQLLGGGGALLGLSALFEEGAGIAWTPRFVGVLLYLALVGTAFALCLWYWLVQRSEVGRLGLLLFMVPVLGLALAAVVFHERIRSWEAAGVVVTLAGLGMLVAEEWRSTGGRDGLRAVPPR